MPRADSPRGARGDVLGQGSFGVVRVAWVFSPVTPTAEAVDAACDVHERVAASCTTGEAEAAEPVHGRRVPDALQIRPHSSSSTAPCVYTAAVKTVRVPFSNRTFAEYVAAASFAQQLPPSARALAVSASPLADVKHDERRRCLWNELRLLEHIRTHPHPNIVQCWGFSFPTACSGGGQSPLHRRTHPDRSTGAVTDVGVLALTYQVPSASAQPLESLWCAARRAAHAVIQQTQAALQIDLTCLFASLARTDGRVMDVGSAAAEPLSRPDERQGCLAEGLDMRRRDLLDSVSVPDYDDADGASSTVPPEAGEDVYRVPFSFVLDAATEAHVVLSLCSGGTLKAYVQRQAAARTEELFSGLVRTAASAVVPTATAAGSAAVGTAVAEKEHMTMADAPRHGSNEASAPGATSSLEKPFNSGSSASVSVVSPPVTSAPLNASSSSPLFAGARWTLAVSERCVVAILVALLHALHHVHNELGVLHRDVKPANVLLCVGDSAETPSSLTAGAARREDVDGGDHRRSPSTCSDRASTMWWSTSRPRAVGGAPQAHPATFPVLVAPASRTPLRLQTTETRTHKPRRPARPEHRSASADRCARRVTHHKVEVHVLPQPEAWRVQLADFGVSTPPGQLSAAQRGVGTLAFMAPEVRFCGVPRCVVAPPATLGATATAAATEPESLLTPLFDAYGTAADVYALGATCQFVLVRAMVGVPSIPVDQLREWLATMGSGTTAAMTESDRARRIALLWEATGDGHEWSRQLRQLSPRATGARWVDEVSQTPGEATAPPSVEPPAVLGVPFVVPQGWRCDQEIAAAMHVRPHSQTNSDTPFVVPAAWRCREELLRAQHVRTRSSAVPGSHSVEEDVLFEGSTPRSRGYKSQQRRCRSCGKLHRHLVELLNAMTDPDPSQRPTVLDCLRSTAVLEQGQMEEVPTERRAHQPRHRARPTKPTGIRSCGATCTPTAGPDSTDEGELSPPASEPGTPIECTYLWRPPSLHFLKSQEDVTY